MHGFTSNNKAVLLYCIFQSVNNHNRTGIATQRAGGLQSPCKRSRYSNRAVGNSNKQGTQNNSQTNDYDEFMNQIRTMRHSFNTIGSANYRIQLAVPPSTKNNHDKNHNNTSQKS